MSRQCEMMENEKVGLQKALSDRKHEISSLLRLICTIKVFHLPSLPPSFPPSMSILTRCIKTTDSLYFPISLVFFLLVALIFLFPLSLLSLLYPAVSQLSLSDFNYE